MAPEENNTNLDKKYMRFLKNITYFITRYSITKAKLEKTAGVSIGTINRLTKDSNLNSPGLSIALALSEMCNVPVDALFTVNFSQLTKQEESLSDYFSKVIKETQEGVLGWNRESYENFDNYSVRSEHPLFSQYAVSSEDIDFAYKSMFETSSKFINNDCFYAEIDSGTRMYIMSVSSTQEKDESFEFELYFVSYDKENTHSITPICTVDVFSSLFSLVSNMYMAARESSSHLNLNSDAKRIIDNFINHK